VDSAAQDSFLMEKSRVSWPKKPNCGKILLCECHTAAEHRRKSLKRLKSRHLLWFFASLNRQ
jgi:hypothetical protein